MPITPSPFQQRIYREFQDTPNGILINAVAGSGKSTTIVEIARLTPADKRVIFLAFNKDIVRDLSAKLKDRTNVEVRTLHSFGLTQLSRRFGSTIKVDDDKVSKIILKLADNWGPFLDDNREPSEGERLSYCSRVARIVDIARFSLPQTPAEMLELCERHDVPVYNGEIERAKEVIRQCNAYTDSFDFVDMIYRPAIAKWDLKQYDVVIVDECQDLNRAQQAILRKIVAPGGRLVAVGDPSQAIYGFAGASVESFNELRTLFPGTVELPLSVSYRCDAEIVEHAQGVVPQIAARPSAGRGEVRQASKDEIQDGDFVLCRNTRPLVALCLQFIAKGRRASIKGRDIGRSLMVMVRATKAKTTETMNKRLDADLQKLIAKTKAASPLRNPEEAPTVANMRDRIGAIRSMAEGFKCKTPEEICTAIAGIFTDETSEGIVFSTMHKAKGLEADRVFIIDNHLLGQRATAPWQRVQEENLRYVSITRARKQLLYVSDWTSDPTKRRELERSLAGIREK